MLKASLSARVPDVDVLTTAEWRRMQESYWMIGTGAGITVLLAAGLGVLVGGVVVAQTIYAATVDHIREYGTLKAMGASNGYLYQVILKQASISGCIGYSVGMAISVMTATVSPAGVEEPLLCHGGLWLACSVSPSACVWRHLCLPFTK